MGNGFENEKLAIENRIHP